MNSLSLLLLATMIIPPMPSADQLPERPEMPDPLMLSDGQRVASAAQWQQRRTEMKQIIEHYLTGTMPAPPGNVQGQDLVGGLLVNDTVRFRRVRLTFGPERALSFEIAIFIPVAATAPAPTIVHLSYTATPGSPRHAAQSTQAAEPTRNFRALEPEEAARGYAEPLSRGYAVVSYDYQQCGFDQRECRSTGFFPAYPDYDWGDLAAWAWSMSRVADYLQTQDFADKQALIAVGNSRRGKATLIAGAFDERFALVAPVGSGCGGSGAFRFNGPGRGGKEGIEVFATRFDYQLSPRMPQFIGHVNRLPFDQHWLIALVAPRPLICCEAIDDEYCNGNATRQSYLGAKPVYEFLQASNQLGINFRPGKHDLAAEDWQAILDFADWQLRGTKTTRRFDRFPPDEQMH